MNFNHEYAFPQHPPDHPLWRDVNFCPPEVYRKLIQPLTMQTANKANKGKKGTKGSRNTMPCVHARKERRHGDRKRKKWHCMFRARIGARINSPSLSMV